MEILTNLNLEKFAYELKEHQKRVIEKLKHNDAVLVYHGLGSGKTLTALAASEQLNSPLSVIGPASLKKNFPREKRKHGIHANVRAYTYNKPPEEEIPGMVAFDEAHRMGRIGTKRSELPDTIKAKKRLLLTGTPIRNDPAELIPLMRGLGIQVPRDPERFHRRYIEDVEVKPGLIDRWFRGVKPWTEEHVKNVGELKKMLHGKVDYYKPEDGNYPHVQQHNIQVEMTPKQEEAYRMATKGYPSLAYKVTKGLAASKEEKRHLNAFLTATRQISNYPGEYHLGSTMEDAPKIQTATKSILRRMKTDPRYKGVTYSAYLGSGINPMEEMLKRNKVSYAKFTGEMPDEERNKAVKAYNAGRIKQLLISGAGGEGLDLKGTKLLQVMAFMFWSSQSNWLKRTAGRRRGRRARPGCCGRPR